MKILRMALAVIFVLFTLNISFPEIVWAKDSQFTMKSKTTHHEPEFLSTPEIEPKKVIEKKISWGKSLLVIGLLGGIAAGGIALGSGGSGESNGGSGSDGDDQGTIKVDW